VIDPDRLAGGIARLDVGDRELLAYSLGKRVPDQQLARLYDCRPQDIPRRRAEAIDELAGLLGIERSAEIGALLQALLEPATWEEDGPASWPERSPERGPEPSPPELAPEPSPPEPAPGPPPPEPVPNRESKAAEVDDAETFERELLAPQPIGPEPEIGALVLPAPEQPRRPGTPVRRLALWVGGTVGMLGLVAAAALFGASRSSNGTAARSSAPQTRLFSPETGGSLSYPFPSVSTAAPCHATATVHGRAMLYRRPGGRPSVPIAGHTEWGSPRIVGVARRRGRWLAVQVPELPNHKVGWLPSRRAELGCVRWAMYADLSRRRLVVRHDGHTVHRFLVAIGSPQHPTPQGRYSVTDKLRVRDPGSPYGCCILALTGHQTKLPPDWPGGDRLAVHAAKDPASIGHAVSLGCMRVSSGQARWLLRTIPLGTPIFIRS
jgi:hypothetical protein